MIFLPLGGIFVFGAGGILGAVIGFVNVFLGGLALLFGYMYGITWLVIMGYIVIALGLISGISGLFTKIHGEKD